MDPRSDRPIPPSLPPREPSVDESKGPPVAVVAEPRQRWRITFAREPVPVEQVGRAALDAWQETLVASGLPVAGLEAGGTGRPRIALGAPLPAAMSGAAELADLHLLERRVIWQVREALEPRLPSGYRWVGAEDVWLGAPPLAGRVAAADWRVELAPVAPSDVERVHAAGRALLAATELPRTRAKGGQDKRYDLRPLLADLAIEDDQARSAAGLGSALAVCFRTRIHPELGSGRPEEVVAALADRAGAALEAVGIVRTRLVLAEDLIREPAPGDR